MSEPNRDLTPHAFALYFARRLCRGWDYEEYKAMLDYVAAHPHVPPTCSGSE